MRLYTVFFIAIMSLGVFASSCLAQTIFSGLIISERKDGIKIVEVQSGSPGFDAGLRKGDIVLEIDGKKTKKLGDYVEISREVRGKKVEVSLVILRKGVSYDVTIMIYSVPIYQHWKVKVTKPIELPRGLTNTPYVYWVGKGFRALTKPNDKLSFGAKIANYNLALKFLLNALHYRPESIDTALKVAKSYNELGKLYVMNGDIKEGIINFRKSIRFYAGCHGKTENEDHLNVILASLQEIEKSLTNIESDNLETPTVQQRKSLRIQQ
ncbi:MAG: PDZ domain-containing protein [Candidatus Scalindua sp.]